MKHRRTPTPGNYYTRARLGCTALALAAVVVMSVHGADTPPKLIEFGLEVPARPLPLPDWNAPAPSGVSVRSEELPPTPVPAVPSEPPSAERGHEARSGAMEGAQQAAPAALRTKMRFLVRGNRALSVETIQKLLTPYVFGDDLPAACEALQRAYIEAIRSYVHVRAAPPVDNVVLIEVTEPRLRSLRIVPARAENVLRIDTELSDTAAPELRMTRGLRVIRSTSVN